ncbi:hypothetical protein [Treponema endosymbiont of Eucomonympha sp.]|nr:hypothetical protein [Treponema endosymbiont of Eucomonympha sp.]
MTNKHVLSFKDSIAGINPNVKRLDAQAASPLRRMTADIRG